MSFQHHCVIESCAATESAGYATNLGEPSDSSDHVGRFVHDNDGARTESRAKVLERVVIHPECSGKSSRWERRENRSILSRSRILSEGGEKRDLQRLFAISDGQDRNGATSRDDSESNV